MKKKRRAAASVANFNLRLKAECLTGKDFWSTLDLPEYGLPQIRFADGPNGLRVQKSGADNFGLNASLAATCFPCACALACGWDKSLAEGVGERLGEEAAYFGADVLLGPAVNIKRNPLCGRNFEYFSEDAYLSGTLAAAYIRGVQARGVSACVKHFAANNREFARTIADSRVSEAALREIYLMPFELAVKEGGAEAVMTAYNKLNGVYCSQNKWLISHILRGEWNFGGIVISDWVGTSDRVEGIKAGEDLEMPRCKLSAEQITAAVERGELAERDIDLCIERLKKFALKTRHERLQADFEEHAEYARKVVAECAVLLKNDGILPLQCGEEIAVIGALCQNPHLQGGGSAQVNSIATDNILKSLAQKFKICGFERGYRQDGKRDKRAAKRALKLALRAKKVVFFAGLSKAEDTEGADRQDMLLPLCQRRLLKALCDAGVKPVVVLFAGGAIECDWQEYAAAILHMHLSGGGTGGAAARLLCGEVNPSGKLAESYPLSYQDVPFGAEYAANTEVCDYREDIFVGYKYYDAAQKAVRYPFGFGLSYTKFEYSHLLITKEGVSLDIKNTGLYDGAEVAQLYISPPEGIYAAERALKGFVKVFLKAGEKRQVFIPFDEYSFRTYDKNAARWRIFGGEYKVAVGSSSRDMRLSGSIVIAGEAQGGADGAALKAQILAAAQEGITSQAYENKPRERKKRARREVDFASPFIELKNAKGLAGRLIYAFANFYCTSKKDKALLTFRYITMRSVAQYAGFNLARAQGFLDICNGKFFRGLKKLISGKGGK